MQLSLLDIKFVTAGLHISQLVLCRGRAEKRLRMHAIDSFRHVFDRLINDTRLSKLRLLSLFDRRFIRDVTFLFNVINGHYDIDISNKLKFCKERSMGYNLRKNDTQDLVPNFSRTNRLKYSFFLTILLMNGIVYQIILENQIILKLLKIMFSALLRIARTSLFRLLYNFW